MKRPIEQDTVCFVSPLMQVVYEIKPDPVDVWFVVVIGNAEHFTHAVPRPHPTLQHFLTNATRIGT